MLEWQSSVVLWYQSGVWSWVIEKESQNFRARKWWGGEWVFEKLWEATLRELKGFWITVRIFCLNLALNSFYCKLWSTHWQWLAMKMPTCLLLVAAPCLPPVQTAFIHFPKPVLLMHEQGRYKYRVCTKIHVSCFVTGAVPSLLVLPAAGVTFKASDTGKAVTVTALLHPDPRVCHPHSWVLCLRLNVFFPIYWCYYFVLLTHLAWISFP